MREWKESKLADAPLEILDGDRGKNYPSQDEFMPSGHCLFLSTKNVRIDGFEFSECQFISRERDELLRKGKLERDDLVLTTRGTVGNLGFYDSSVTYDNVRINSGMVIVRPKKNELLPSFNYYLFRKLQNDFHTFTSGSAQPQLPIRDLKEVEVSIPPFPEQKAIASVLSSLDDKIDLLHRQNKTLEAMAETLFRQWFVEEAQEDWETLKVGDFVKTNVSSITQESKLKTIRYLDTGSLNEGKIEGFQVLDIKDAPSRARRIVKHNDILISTVRPDQKHYGIIKNPDEDIIVSTGFCVISCKKINPHFIYILLTTKDMTEYLHSIAEASTSTYPSLKPSDMECLEFKLPPIERLREFSKYADDAWDKIEYNHIQIRTLENLRNTLLPKLMSGEVRVAI